MKRNMPLRRTQEEVIESFKKVHGDRYDYSRVVYAGSNSKVIIGCKEHGWFDQSPNNHNKGAGCPQCGRARIALSRTMNVDEVICQFIEVHGERYDYSKVNYVSNTKHVTIGCSIHGWFEQAPGNHKIGQGCIECSYISKGNSNLSKQDDVIAAFVKAHGNTYDYSQVIYTGQNNKVKIGCPKHGQFEQTPATHKDGSGCQKCANTKRSKAERSGSTRPRVSKEKFIERSKNHHGNKFDYSLVDLEKGMAGKVKIICPFHGVFLQQAQHHANGFGCRKCKAKKVGERFKLTHEEFLAKAIRIHGDTYDYSKTKYVLGNENVIIICKKHGEFLQKPYSHLKGKGCTKCGLSRGEKAICSWIKSQMITYEVEKGFIDCISPKGKVLKFDFYLPNHNVHIEFDGEQHYKEVKHFKSYSLKQRQQYDRIKTKYAKKKGIPLLRIPYFRIDEIPTLLSEFLFQITAAAA